MRHPLTSALLALLMLVPSFPLDTNANPSPASHPLVREISANWRFRQIGKEAWMPARVPGSVHTDLLANKAIPDPFFRDNEAKVQWIGYADWEYETAFDADAATIARDRVELVFEGLDTYATDPSRLDEWAPRFLGEPVTRFELVDL